MFHMKIVDGFILRKIGAQYFVTATGEKATQLNGIVELNEVAACIWKMLQSGCSYEELYNEINSQFVCDDNLQYDLHVFLEEMEKNGFLSME